jgi:hypothetical protein
MEIMDTIIYSYYYGYYILTVSSDISIYLSIISIIYHNHYYIS